MGTFEILPSCTWIGDLALSVPAAASDGTTEPLVTDQDETFNTVSTAIGGGFTADMVYLQTATSITNGFDITINWNPKVLRMALFDQGGLPWNTNNPFTGVFALDNSVGQLHVVQVIFSALGGDFVFFRLRFDVIGIGSSGLTITNDIITNPGAVVHQTFNGAFDAETFFDPTHTLNWAAGFTNSTPIIPGSTNNFLATVTGGTGTYTYAWDLNSDGTTDSTTNPASLIIPTATLTGHRIRLTVTDSGSNVISMSQRLPLTVFVQGPRSTTVGTANTYTGNWLGGIPPYTGNWRFCPGGLVASVDCNRPAPTIAATTGQVNSQTGTTAITYSEAGVYTNTLKIADAGSPVIPGGGASVTFAYFVNVTGTPQVYTITLSVNPTTTTIGQTVQYTANVAYAAGYTTSLESSTISVKFVFGDGSTATMPVTITAGAGSTSTSHTYLAASPASGYTVLAIGQETASNAVSMIQEVSNRITETVNKRSTSTSVSCSPGTVSVGTASTCTATVTDSSPGTASTPAGTVGFASDGAGTFDSPSCTLVAPTTGPPSCSVHYTPTAAGSGTHTIAGTYSGDLTHATSQGTGTVIVSGGAPTVAVNSPTPNPANTGAMVTVTFTVTSSSTVTGITVDWGDGTATDSLPGTATSDTHIYANTGTATSQTFTIKVTATNTAGPGSGTTMETINDLPPVVSVPNVLPNPANTGQLVTATFTATDPDGTVSSITVNWGDGTAVDTLAGTATSDTHTYSTANAFTITITATDNSGSKGQNTGSITVQTPVSVPTVTVNNPTPNPANTGQMVTVTFTVSSTATVTGITVNWGDGTTNTLAGTATSDTHTYTSTGSVTSKMFTVTVTATNSAGPGSGTTSETVNDRPPVVTISTVSPNPVNSGVLVAVTFTATDPDGTVSSISVNWGDSTTPDTLAGTATSDTHTYNSAGSFTITITATDNSGSTDQGTAPITVNAIGVPTVTVNPPTPNPVDTGATVTVTFTVTSAVTVTGITVNWGDGTTNTLVGSATSDTHIYANTGAAKSQVFTITVTATNSAGPGSGTTTETVSDRVPVVSVTNVQPNPVNTGVLVTVTFTATDPDGAVSSISVDWGDSAPPDSLAGTATSDTHTYASAGSFTITVTATDNSGSTGQGTGSITVNVVVGAPTVTVTSPTPNPATTKQTVTVTFTVSSAATVTGITVDWGDSTTPDTLSGTATSDAHTYASTGNVKSQIFTITVTATNSAGPGSGTTTETVNDQPPTASIVSITPNPVNTGSIATVSFSATDTDGTVSSISVDWGDSTTADMLPGTATSDTHTYNTGGSFTITIMATDNSGSTGQTTGSVTVTVPVGVPTVAVNSPTPNSADTGTTVTVTFTVTSTATVTGITVNWGDGTTTDSLPGTAISDAHMYANTGNAKSQSFTITVTATNSAGPGSGTTTEMVNDRSPTASLTFTPPNPSAGQTVSFDATASADPDGTVASYAWDFGDGTSGTGVTPTHVYNPAATMSFTVMLTVTDNSGNTGSMSQSITVTVTSISPPTVSITNVSPNPANTGQMVTLTFTVSSSATVTGVTVDWGDGTTPDSLLGTATSDTHSYLNTGNSMTQTFKITVTATNSGGPGLATTTETVNDRPPAVTISTVSPNPANTGQLVTVSFTATDPDGMVSSVSVDWGDMTTSDSLAGTATSDTHTYASAGSFTTTVTATDDSGSTGFATIPETVTSTTTQPVQLTFQGFDLDDFDNGVGQLQVLVNGHLVVDIPAGLNHLTGSGDYTPYMNRWVSFGPFDITSFVVQGQNTIVFLSPPPGHFGLIKNVTIIQGKTLLLHVAGVRYVSLLHPVTFTFSIPLLVITSFTISDKNPIEDEPLTFTATYTGGTGPFTCTIRFGDEESTTVPGISGSCSATHDYDYPGSFHARVAVRGSSTSDLISSSLTITVGQTDPAASLNQASSTSPFMAEDSERGDN